MDSHAISLFFLGTIAVSYCNANPETTVVLSHVVFRHGDRTPLEPFRGDPHGNDSQMGLGWGQLTMVGQQQHLELGSWIRRHYAHLLSDVYSREEVVVRSTDVDRTLMSAQCTLAGLYPAVDTGASLGFQPVPIHTVPVEDDWLLGFEKPCPRLRAELSRAVSAPENLCVLQRSTAILEYLTTHAGQNVTTVDEATLIYDTLQVEDIHNMTLPPWASAVYPQPLRSLTIYEGYLLPTATKELQRLDSGPLLGEMVDHMGAKRDGALSPDRNLFLYSAHDSTVASLLHTLQVMEPIEPPYAAAVLVEMVRVGGGNLSVRVLYRNASTEPTLLVLPGCAPICSLDRFLELVGPLVDGARQECDTPAVTGPVHFDMPLHGENTQLWAECFQNATTSHLKAFGSAAVVRACGLCTLMHLLCLLWCFNCYYTTFPIK